MKKEEGNKLISAILPNTHPANHRWNFSQVAADKMTAFIGSWIFIIAFTIILILWVLINSWWLIQYGKGEPFDPFPFIFLNLVLSCLAAIQAPIILMSQNRESQKDRLRAQYDYSVNRKAEKEIEEVQEQLKEIKDLLKK